MDSAAEDLQIGKIKFHRPLIPARQVGGRGAGVLRQLA